MNILVHGDRNKGILENYASFNISEQRAMRVAACSYFNEAVPERVIARMRNTHDMPSLKLTLLDQCRGRDAQFMNLIYTHADKDTVVTNMVASLIDALSSNHTMLVMPFITSNAQHMCRVYAVHRSDDNVNHILEVCKVDMKREQLLTQKFIVGYGSPSYTLALVMHDHFRAHVGVIRPYDCDVSDEVKVNSMSLHRILDHEFDMYAVGRCDIPPKPQGLYFTRLINELHLAIRYATTSSVEKSGSLILLTKVKRSERVSNGT